MYFLKYNYKVDTTWKQKSWVELPVSQDDSFVKHSPAQRLGISGPGSEIVGVGKNEKEVQILLSAQTTGQMQGV